MTPVVGRPNYTAKNHAKDSFNALVRLLTQEPTPVQKIWELNTCVRSKQNYINLQSRKIPDRIGTHFSGETALGNLT